MPAAGDITPGTVRNHAAEEHRVEPREGAVEAGDETPGHGEPDIGGVVDLAGEAIPAVNEDGAGGGLDNLGVVDGLPWNLGEGPTVDNLAGLRGTETVLLGVAAVPDPVPEEVSSGKGTKSPRVPAVGVRVMVGKVDCAVAVGQRDTREVPEDKHESPLLEVHVPGSDNELLGLAAGVGVKPVSHQQEADLARHKAVLFVLTSSCGETENEEEVPRHANLAEHLEVEDAEHTRVELGAHEEVIDGVAGHAVLLAAPEGREVGDEGDDEPAEDGDGQQGAELIDDVIQSKEAAEVQNAEDSEGRVHASVGIAEIWKTLATSVRQRLSIAPNSRKGAVAEALEDQVGPVPNPNLQLRESTGVDEVGKMADEIEVGLVRAAASWDFAVIVGCADPHVPHEDREEDHESQSTERATKLEFARVIDLGIQARAPAINHRLLLNIGVVSHSLGADGSLAFGSGAVGEARSVTISMTVGMAVGVAIRMAIRMAIGGRLRHVVFVFKWSNFASGAATS